MIIPNAFAEIMTYNILGNFKDSFENKNRYFYVYFRLNSFALVQDTTNLKKMHVNIIIKHLIEG